MPTNAERQAALALMRLGYSPRSAQGPMVRAAVRAALQESAGFLRIDEVEEHAQLFSGGSMLVRNSHPEIERIFPLADWIKASSRGGGKVYRRVITVIEDWVEVTQ